MLKNLDETQFRCARHMQLCQLKLLHRTIKFATGGSWSSCLKTSILIVTKTMNNE